MIDLYTEAGERLLKAKEEIPWQEYPRPRMVRNAWANLNGWWEFAVTSDERPPRTYDRSIRVPFVPESTLSGIHEAIADGSYLWYRRKIAASGKGRTLLHIGAADQEVTAWVDGRRAPLAQGRSQNGYTHLGGYEPMTYDVTTLLTDGEAELVLQVYDRLAGYQMPYGKQSLTRGGMWYTPCSGIWQTVWMETVPETYIQNVRTAYCEQEGGWEVSFFAEGVKEGTVLFDGNEYPLCEGKAVLSIKEPHLWSPEEPYLYDFTVRSGQDEVQSYFALRSLETKTIQGLPRLCLNGKPYFFHGLLDQGYWPDGIFTPAEPECMREEIRKVKALGFNMLRKHIKVEPEIFYYECDRMGIAVFQDMVQNGAYSFFHDTALPTVGIQKKKDGRLHKDPIARENFVEGMLATVRQLKEHPCIVYWTIFNEGWGQFSGTQMYMQLKREDDTRWIDTASGWFRGPKSDVESRHVYFTRLSAPKKGLPFVLSEFGGYAYQPEGHVVNPEKMYGYKKFQNSDACAQAIVSLYRDKILPLVKKGLCAAVYTQVSDVEDETNGLFSYDRKIDKLTPEVFAAVSEELKTSL